MTPKKTILALALAYAAGSVLLWPRAEAADPPQGAPSGPLIVVDEPRFSGVFACLGCHSAGEQTPYRASLERVRLDEVSIWHREDKHRLAYCVLQGELAKQMSSRLGYDVAKAKECLACHAPNHELREPADSPNPNYKLSEGVTCEDCHGASRGWHRLHVVDAPWQALPLAQRKKIKEQHGMRELADPLTRAEVCLDCHVGNAAQEQFVTHEMYAAGHPPLASVDVVQYADQMPPHWHKDEVGRVRPAANDDEPFLATRQALAGYLIAGERALQLIGTGPGRDSDFALFDCDACHHELEQPSWRLSRFTSGVPGRPGYREWSLAAAMLATKISGSDATNDQVAALVKDLHRYLQPQAFGSKDVEAPLALASVWKDQAERLSQNPLDQVAMDRLVVTLLDEALDPKSPPDFDTARAYASILKTAFVDLNAFDPLAESPARTAWEALAAQLALNVPPRAKNDGSPITLECDGTPEEPIATALPETLEARANYNPTRFQSALRTFSNAVRRGDMARTTAASRRR